MSLRLHKVVVQVVLAEERDGEVVGERISQPTDLYGMRMLQEFVDGLADEIAKQSNPNDNGQIFVP